MPTETIIRTLKEAKQENPKHILPRTVLKAIADENGDFVSSDVTAQDINQLHGKTLVTANAQTLTDAQKAQARANINAAAPDGYYGNSGGVMQYSTNFLGKNTPQNASNVVFRPTAANFSGSGWSADSISGQTATIEKIKGKTLVWNQLLVGINKTNIGSTGMSTAQITLANGTSHITLESGTTRARLWVYNNNRNGVSFKSNHKYYTSLNIDTNAENELYRMRANAANSKLFFYDVEKGHHETIYTFSTTEEAYVDVYAAETWDVTDSTYWDITVMLIDLTQMYGAGHEPETVEEFKAQFPLDYYAYNTGELISLNATGLKTVGFNQLYADGHIDVLKGMTYKIEGTYTSLKDSAGNDVTVTNGEFTPTANDTYTMVGGSCVHLKWSGVRDGDTEEHWDSTLSLPISTYFQDGMKSAGTVYDELTKDRAIQRIGSRAYQTGDEDDSTVITDKTTTYYALETPVETPISPELNLTYRCDDFGTEMLLPQNDDEPVTAPMDCDITYQLDYEADVRNMDVNMISKSSMDNFIASFNASGLGTITQTYNPNTKQYEYTVTAPQPEPTEGGETV